MGASKRQVRWKQGRNYRYGYIGETLVTARDGSVKVTERYSEKVRSLDPAVLQVAERGPRGGKRWVPLGLAEAVADQVPQSSSGVTWQQLGLFGGDAA